MNRSSSLIAIVGGSASGKTRLAHSLARQLAALDAYVIKEDDYYVDAGNLPGFDPLQFNFDEPAAKDHDLLRHHLAQLKSGQVVDAPRYDFTTHCRCATSIECAPAPVIVVEGLHLLATPELAALFDLSVYVDACQETRFRRRLARDIAERDRTPQFVRDQFDSLVQPMHVAHVEPQKQNADLVIENMGAPNFEILVRPILSRLPILEGPAETD
ncbi:uridine kinase [Maricaulis sp. CAU 1757]